jgi:hypothetical protein
LLEVVVVRGVADVVVKIVGHAKTPMEQVNGVSNSGFITFSQCDNVMSISNDGHKFDTNSEHNSTFIKVLTHQEVSNESGYQWHGPYRPAGLACSHGCS